MAIWPTYLFPGFLRLLSGVDASSNNIADRRFCICDLLPPDRPVVFYRLRGIGTHVPFVLNDLLDFSGYLEHASALGYLSGPAVRFRVPL